MDVRHLLRPANPVPAGLNPETLTEEHPDWKQTFTGAAILVASPGAQDVSLLDMAVAIAGINRYDHHTLIPWAVAPHSLLAVMLYRIDQVKGLVGTPLSELDILLHDAHESIIGDQTNPVANAFEKLLPGFRGMLKKLKADWDEAIYSGLGLPPIGSDSVRRDIVRTYDFKALYVERDAIMMEPPSDWVFEKEMHDTSKAYPEAKAFIQELSSWPVLYSAGAWLSTFEEILQKIDERDALGWVNTDEAHRQVADAAVRLNAFMEALANEEEAAEQEREFLSQCAPFTEDMKRDLDDAITREALAEVESWDEEEFMRDESWEDEDYRRRFEDEQPTDALVDLMRNGRG